MWLSVMNLCIWHVPLVFWKPLRLDVFEAVSVHQRECQECDSALGTGDVAEIVILRLTGGVNTPANIVWRQC